MALTLHGYRYSVYSWIARLALHEKGVGYDWAEVDPFDPAVPPAYLDLHPFRRVPTLVDGDFALYETGAITRYVDERFPGPRLQPLDGRQRARMHQVLSIIDSYGYWPLVRQVFAHGYFRARTGRSVDPAEYQAGLAAAPRVLQALARLAAGGSFLVTDELSLADIHLAPMLAYFVTDEAGAAMLGHYPKLASWWSTMAARPAFVATRPALP